MPKYVRKLSYVEAEKYTKGMEDGWEVLFSGNMFGYNKIFKSEENCWYFIHNNLGKNECDIEDANYEIIYEDPAPFIKTMEGNTWINEGDYILFLEDGSKHVMAKDVFEEAYELA
jgi:hypothetical protein